MQKMLPEGAVRQKMATEGCSPEEIEGFFTGLTQPSGSVSDVVPIAASVSSIVMDTKYDKYIKMKKMLPEGAVRQKMMSDGLSEEETEQFFSGMLSGTSAPPPPPSSAVTVTTAPTVDPKYEKYVKMRKMLPEGAVRQKMATDGFTSEDVDAFFNGTVGAGASTDVGIAPPPAPAAASVDPKYEKYVKMKKMLPEGAVRQKMLQDGFPETEIEAFFNGPPTPSVQPAAAAATMDPKYDKYVKMKKMLPEGAVRQKMMQEGISGPEIDAFFNGTLAGSGSPASAVSVVAVDPKYEKYVKMKKMLPEGAVRQKMMQDGLTEADVEYFFKLDLSGATAAGSGSDISTQGGGGPKLSLAGAAVVATVAAKKPAAAAEPEQPPQGMGMKNKIQPATKLKG
jgi:hypothetical protein